MADVTITFHLPDVWTGAHLTTYNKGRNQFFADMKQTGENRDFAQGNFMGSVALINSGMVPMSAPPEFAALIRNADPSTTDLDIMGFINANVGDKLNEAYAKANPADFLSRLLPIGSTANGTKKTSKE